MEIHPLAVLDAYRLTPSKLTDSRGCVYEALRHDTLLELTGHSFTPRQVNFSVSRRGTVRGIHGVLLPPGQAKFVSCVRGEVIDVVVDIRLGSPTFGSYHANRLDADSAECVYIAEGLGHGFVALTDDACMEYLCSTIYEPATPFEINPLDPAMSLPWDVTTEPLMSAKDKAAPSLAEAQALGLLPSYKECKELYAVNRRTSANSAPSR